MPNSVGAGLASARMKTIEISDRATARVAPTILISFTEVHDIMRISRGRVEGG